MQLDLNGESVKININDTLEVFSKEDFPEDSSDDKSEVQGCFL